MKFNHLFRLQSVSPSTRIYEADGVTVRIDFLENMLRVAVLHPAVPLLPTWSVCPGARDCPLEGRDKLSLDGFSLAAPAVTLWPDCDRPRARRFAPRESISQSIRTGSRPCAGP